MDASVHDDDDEHTRQPSRSPSPTPPSYQIPPGNQSSGPVFLPRPSEYSQIPNTPLPESKFQYRDLARLGQYSVETPLRCIAHIDLDAFYAQCEMVRLKAPEDEPLAVSQWGNLIAINYPARALGLTSRHASAVEAKKLVPNLRVVHIATWIPGDPEWRYRPERSDTKNEAKACLDPYRIEGRKILNIFRENCGRVEKASVDESYLDLGPEVLQMVRERFPEVREGLDSGLGDAKLPPPRWNHESELEWKGVLIHGGDGEAPDWDDVVLALAAEKVQDIRRRVRERLGYTCSAGIARNKILAKLGSGQNKPNNQTVVRTRAIPGFLAKFPITKLRSLGAKRGRLIEEFFGTTSIPELLQQPFSAFQACFRGDGRFCEQHARWVYDVIRGVNRDMVATRTELKQMNSVKSYTTPVKDLSKAIEWIRVFCTDIVCRIEDDDTRRPTKFQLSWWTENKKHYEIKGAFPWGKGRLTRDGFFEMLMEIIKKDGLEKFLVPMTGMGLAAGAFEECGAALGRNISTFFKRVQKAEGSEKADSGGGQERQSLKRKFDSLDYDFELDTSPPEFSLFRPDGADPLSKLDANAVEFLERKTEVFVSRTDEETDARFLWREEKLRELGYQTWDGMGVTPLWADKLNPMPPKRNSSKGKAPAHQDNNQSEPQVPIAKCPKCLARIPLPEMPEHEDFHVARELQEQERAAARAAIPEHRDRSNNLGDKSKLAFPTITAAAGPSGATAPAQQGQLPIGGRYKVPSPSKRSKRAGVGITPRMAIEKGQRRLMFNRE